MTVDANCREKKWLAPTDEEGAGVKNLSVRMLIGDKMEVTVPKILEADVEGVTWSEVCGYATV